MDLTLISPDVLHTLQVLDGVGGGNHRTILTMVCAAKKKESKRKTRRNFLRADWALYSKTSNQRLCDIEDLDIEKFNENDTATILKVLKLAYPKGKL